VRRVALALDDQRPLVFDDHFLATRFAQGLVDAGLEKATVADLAGGDAALVDVLDRHDAPEPATFEIEVPHKAPRGEWGDAAYALGVVLGGRMFAAYHLTNPN
jgi:hypothetical protein